MPIARSPHCFSFICLLGERERKGPLKPTGSVPRKRTGATLSPRGEAGAPNGFVQEKRQERGRAAAGSREGMDRAPGLVAALAAWPGRAGASAPSCLGRETTGRAGLPDQQELDESLYMRLAFLEHCLYRFLKMIIHAIQLKKSQEDKQVVLERTCANCQCVNEAHLESSSPG